MDAMIRTLVVLALAACSAGDVPPNKPGAVSSDDAILEVVFVHEIKNGGMKPDETACLRVRDAGGGTADASPALVAAVRANFRRVVAASACTGGGFDPVRVTDPPGPAAMFDIGPVVRDEKGIRVIGGGAHRGGGSAHEIEYTITVSGSSAKVASERVMLTN
jgi:hypothetical protein